MADYYIRETSDGADVLRRISVNVSALICTCHEVSTAHQIVNALKAPQAPPVEWFERWIRNNYQNHCNIAGLCDAMSEAAYGITKEQAPPAAVPVTDAMVERALKVLAFEHDGATFPNAYSFEEVKAERATMRKVLAAARKGE